MQKGRYVLFTAIMLLVASLCSCGHVKSAPITQWTPGTEATPGVAVNDTMEKMAEYADEFIGFEEKDAVIKGKSSELHLTPDDPDAGEENTKKINAWIESAGDNALLQLDKKTYYVAGSVRINGKNGFMLKGKNTVLINTDYDPVETQEGSGRILDVYQSRNITVEGLTLNYYKQVQVTGVIEKIEKGFIYFRAYREFLEGDRLPLQGGEYIYAANVIDADGTPGEEVYINGSCKLEAVEDDLFRYNNTTIGETGDKICLRFYNAGALGVVSDTETFMMRDITVRSNHGLGIYIGGDSKDFCFENMTFRAEKKSQALYSTNVDCFHFGNGLRGKLIVRNSTFDGLGDDVLNIHSAMASTLDPADNSFAPARSNSGDQLDASWSKVGDTIAFYDRTLAEIGRATVTDSQDGRVTVDSLPDGVTKDTFAQNVSLAPFTVVKNCTVSHGRARAFLLQTRNAILEGNTISDMRLAAILIAPDFYSWGEAGYADNILIRNNKISNVCKDETCSKFGAVLIAGCHDLSDYPARTVVPHKNISVVGNTFTDIKAAAIYARAVENPVNQDNTLKNCSEELILIK